MSFYLLYANLLPLDMALTVLVARVFAKGFVQQDTEMVDLQKSQEEGRVVGCQSKNLQMLEDLAQINHVFCDKTGTLTKN
jgi:magnesium-transporting ATPase (P-type)